MGDRDGVVVVPFDGIAEVRAALVNVRAAEKALDTRVRDGLERLDFTRDMLESDRVRWLD
ncbi:MAG: hypothetical protein MI741_18655 [Rhodospirillales bacterium]|nr:hypothetical protein [Rhodospirillales bacterium]